MGEIQGIADDRSVAVTVRYRQVNTDEWQTSEPKSVTGSGRFLMDITGLTRQRYYVYYATTEVDGETIESERSLLAAPSGAAPWSGDPPWGDYSLGPRDGFSLLAPWLNDNTSHVVVREPTRDQLETALSVDGPRVVVFATSGVIDLGGEPLSIAPGRCWIAGQIAPSPGITLVNGTLRVEGDDCVLQHIRVRPGDGSGGRPHGIEIADGVSGTIVDHCSVTWAVDSGIAVGADTDETAITNCLVAEGLQNATHPDGRHGHGVSVGDGATNVAMLANLLAFNNGRQPRLGEGATAAIGNNLVHHYRSGCRLEQGSSASLVGNVYRNNQSAQPAVHGTGAAFLEDTQGDAGGDISELSSRPLWPERANALPSDQTVERTLSSAGAWPGERTSVDQRIVGNVRSGSGGYIDSQSAVGGYPTLPQNKQDVSTPESAVRPYLHDNALDVE